MHSTPARAGHHSNVTNGEMSLVMKFTIETIILCTDQFAVNTERIHVLSLLTSKCDFVDSLRQISYVGG